MAQIDRLLSHLASRGAVALRMEPNQPPMLESLDGGLSPLLPTPVPPTLLEHLVREILPTDQEGSLAGRGEAGFRYHVGDQLFSVMVNRGTLGFSLRAEPAVPPQSAHPGPPRESTDGVIALAVDTPSNRSIPAPGVPSAAPVAVKKVGVGTHPMAERLFRALLDHKGSDIHCSSFELPLVRVHGDLKELEDFPPLGPKQLQEIMEAIATPLAWRHYEEIGRAHV